MTRTGDESGGVLEWSEHDQVQSKPADVTYAPVRNWSGVTQEESRSRPTAATPPGANHLPMMPSPSIRKALKEVISGLEAACTAMLEAHEGEGVDVVELANAIEDFRSGVNLLWQYKDFGLEPWQTTIAFVRQALCENMHDEEMTRRQCYGLQKIACGYLSNRLLANDDVEEVMSLLSDHDFDIMLFFSDR